MILNGLYHFLTHSADLTGHARDLFAYPQVVAGRTMRSRNDARRQLRDLVGQSVFEAVIPQNAGSVVTAITLQIVGGSADLPLVGETGLQEDIVELRVWTRGHHAADTARTIGRISRIALSNYFGWLDFDKQTWAHGIAIARDLEFFTNPSDGSDRWPGYWSMDLECGWTAPAPIYPDELLTARVTTMAVSGGLLVCGTTSVVPTGRAINLVQFTVRDAPAGNLLKQWSGPPNATVSESGLSGQNIEATVVGLPASGYVELVITDTNQTQSAIGVMYGQ